MLGNIFSGIVQDPQAAQQLSLSSKVLLDLCLIVKFFRVSIEPTIRITSHKGHSIYMILLSKTNYT